jgi:hypothetical protein
MRIFARGSIVKNFVSSEPLAKLPAGGCIASGNDIIDPALK